MSDDDFVIGIVMGQVFTWVDPDLDKVFHFDINRMIAYAKTGGAGVTKIKFAIEPDDVKMIIEKRGIDFEYCRKLVRETPEKLLEPILTIEYSKDPLKHVTVDGHHRYVIWHALKIPDALTYLFEQGSWEQFTLDLPKPMSDALRGDIPP